MPFEHLLVLTHPAATLAMGGLVWFVQVVHYPLFAAVGTVGFSTYSVAHARRTTWVVAPLMLAEAGSALLLAVYRPPAVAAFLVWSGLGLLALIWASTAWLQVPRHTILAQGFDPATCTALVRTNWLRTGAWTLRGVLVLCMVERLLA